MQTLIKNYNLSIAAKIILFGAFFITIASGCFQLEHVLPFMIPVLSLLSKVVFILSFIIHVIICIKKKKAVITKYDCILLVFFAWLIISSILNGNSWLSHFPIIMKTLAIRWLLSLSIIYQKKQVAAVLAFTFSFIIYLNFFFILFLPGFFGYYEGTEVYLLSTNYNQFGAIFVPAIFINLIALFSRKGKISSIIPLLSVCFLSVALEGSVTASVGFALILIVAIFVKNPKLIKLGSISLFIGIILFFITFVIPFFSVLDIPIVSQIVESFGKDMTFSSRTRVWLYADFQISHSPIIGYGVCDKESYELLLSGFVNPHNIILHILLNGGLVGFVIFVIFVMAGINQIKSIANLYQRQMLIFISAVFLLMSQFEVYNNMFIYLFLLFMYMSKDYLSQHADLKPLFRVAQS